jgi:general secretion pathway protein B
MSYILAALKKSEQERDRLEGGNSFPSDNSMPSDASIISNEDDAKSNSAVLIGILSLVLLILLFAFLWLKSTDDRLSEKVNIEPEVVEKNTSRPSVVPIAVKEVSVKKVAVAEGLVLEPKVEIEPKIEAEVEVIGIEQGNPAQLSKVPSISVTSHIYSSQATRRSIVVNDQRLIEGDFVANQVQIKEITSQGMILEVDGLLFAVNRSRGWNR